MLCRSLQWARARTLLQFWHATEVYRYITTPLQAKFSWLDHVCDHYFDIDTSVERAKSGGEFAVQRVSLPRAGAHNTAQELKQVLDVYDPEIGAAIVQRLNGWKRSVPPPSDLFLVAQHFAECALRDTAVAEVVDEFWYGGGGGRDG